MRVSPAAAAALLLGLLAPGPRAAEPVRLEFLFTNDTAGYLEPCG